MLSLFLHHLSAIPSSFEPKIRAHHAQLTAKLTGVFTPKDPDPMPHQPLTPAKRWSPSVTVAAIIEKDGKFLLIEEHTPEGLRLNNPAGHLDPGESPIEACSREALEECAYDFSPTHLVGIYLSRFQRPAKGNAPAEDVTYLRFAFSGELGNFHPDRALDQGIVRSLWMTPEEIRSSAHLHRSPLLLQCMTDHLSGQRFGLEMISTDPSIYR